MAAKDKTEDSPQSWWDARVHEIWDEYDAEFLEYFKDKLLRKILSEENVETNARHYLTGEGSQKSTRCGTPTLPNEEEKRRRDIICKGIFLLSDEYKKLKNSHDTSYLFLNAPRDVVERTYTEDMRANTKQFVNMYEALVSEEKKEKNPRKEDVVNSRSDITRAVRQFFDKNLMKTKHIAIVVNGEGCGRDDETAGDLLLHEDTSPYAIDEFVNEIIKTWFDSVISQTNVQDEPPTPQQLSYHYNDLDVNTPSSEEHGSTNDDVDSDYIQKVMNRIPPLPHRVSVIFGQCQSHALSEYGGTSTHCTDHSRMDVITLTSPRRNDGKAISDWSYSLPFRLPGNDRFVQNSTHWELQRYAEHNRDKEWHEQGRPPSPKPGGELSMRPSQ